ncbi:putative F-box/FBD/LRR-repeat protein [Carex littledalei]|uniref:Putative F-box/FBD/LRR-repeat protein n=1 Tax=Carex littledalei TaxID=544730 RepID=A0A833VF23_9POAL|nr:putative F-box/FBD/LRR-repeat protein [Carex littledalei]
MNNSNNSNDEFDRISSLPDEMLQHILSFLGIRKAIQMSLVSKRWVNLWTSLSHLNFDPHEFVSVDDYGLCTSSKKRALDAKFKKFVEKLLSRHEASFLDTFLIKILDKDCCSDLEESCASYAMKFNPRVFSMEAPLYHISACFFSSESIEELCLRRTSCNFLREIPDVVNLPRIRRLQLTNSKLDNKCITRLFSGCPILEDVSLEDCIGEFSCIFNQKLKYLSLRNCFLFLGNDIFMCVRSCLGDTVESSFGIRCACPSTVDFVWKTLGTTAVGNSFSFMQNLFRCLDLGDYFGGLSDVTGLELHGEDMMSSCIVSSANTKSSQDHLTHECKTLPWGGNWKPPNDG